MIPSNRTRLKQLFLTTDWVTIVRLAENLDRVLD